jgi:aspartyl-tRNA(Asn)/glutamyl-tRNA(Gln) amidotransferase subunit C
MIDRDTILHIARLSRLQLSEQELQSFGQNLGDILTYVEQLNELDTTGIEPASHALPIFNVVRPDMIEHTLDEAGVFANAPDREDDFFRVPRMHG